MADPSALKTLLRDVVVGMISGAVNEKKASSVDEVSAVSIRDDVLRDVNQQLLQSLSLLPSLANKHCYSHWATKYKRLKRPNPSYHSVKTTTTTILPKLWTWIHSIYRMILRALNHHQQTKFHHHKLKQHQYTQQNLAVNLHPLGPMFNMKMLLICQQYREMCNNGHLPPADELATIQYNL